MALIPASKHTASLPSRWLRVELLLFMIVVPLVLWLYVPSRHIITVVWLMALVCYLLLRRSDPEALTGSWRWNAVRWVNLRPVLLRFVLCAAAMLAGTAWLRPDLLFGFVRERPEIWAMVMVLYPILSVVPQEIVFRRYMFARHAAWLRSPWAMIAVSGLGFGFAHIVLNNWVAPLLCVVGGVLFSYTYHKTRSLALVTIEHALYGNFLFTIGLGYYFYHGAAASH